MPRIFDNIEKDLLPALRETLNSSQRADFCVGYFNLRGWKHLAESIEQLEGGDDGCCRLLVGMHKSASEELRDALSLFRHNGRLDNGLALRLKKKLTREFRRQLVIGAPTDADEIALQRLAAQIREQKVRVKLYLRHPLHAKLYLLFPQQFNLESIAFLGSSNLTFSGLLGQGELNVDVKDDTALEKLAEWFEDRWSDRWCIDISGDLIDVLEESWARETQIPPYHIYLKIAYHLSHEARMGLKEFTLPREWASDRLSRLKIQQTHHRQNRPRPRQTLRLHRRGTRLHHQLRHQIPHGPGPLRGERHHRRWPIKSSC